jgi:hypothetical protein
MPGQPQFLNQDMGESHNKIVIPTGAQRSGGICGGFSLVLTHALKPVHKSCKIRRWLLATGGELAWSTRFQGWKQMTLLLRHYTSNAAMERRVQEMPEIIGSVQRAGIGTRDSSKRAPLGITRIELPGTFDCDAVSE